MLIDQVLGRCQIVTEISEGGLGTVYPLMMSACMANVAALNREYPDVVFYDFRSSRTRSNGMHVCITVATDKALFVINIP